MHAQKEKWENSRVKRPCNAYIQFIKNFMAKNARIYNSVTDAVSAGKNSMQRTFN